MQLLSYFKEKNIENCGICSVCINNKREPIPETNKSVKNYIIEALEQQQLSSRALSEKSSFTEQQITKTLKVLLEQNIITITKTNTYKLSHT